MRRLPDLDFFVPEPVRRYRRRDAAVAAVKHSHDVLVVTHGKCLDGVGSYLVHALAAETPPPVIYAQPGEMHEVLEDVASEAGNGRTLSINDLSFDRAHQKDVLDGLRKLKDAGWRVLWRDHHHKQWEGVDTAALDAHLDLFRLDTEARECGTSLAQQDLLPNDPLARDLADIVRDRDLWINKDARSERYEFALRVLGAERFVDSFLATRDVDAAWITSAAEQATVQMDEEVEKAILSADVFGDHGEVGFIYGEVPKNVTLHRLRDQRGTRLEINMKPDGRFSVRSAKGTDVAHLVGQAYGGGGHPNAAGGKARVPPWEWPAFWLQGGLSPAGKSVVNTALRLIRIADADHEPPGKGTTRGDTSGRARSGATGIWDGAAPDGNGGKGAADTAPERSAEATSSS